MDVADAKAILYFGSEGGAGWNSLVGTAFETDRAKTLAWMRAQPPSKERDAMFAEGIWRGTLDEKMEIYAQLTPEGRASAAAHMVQSSMQDGGPEKIEPWVKAQPPGAARRSAILTLAYSQAANAPEKIDTLADAWPAGPDRDAAMRGIASALSNTSTPQRAFDFARRIGDPTQREMSIEQTARSWLYRDEPAARAWITSAPEFSAEQKRVLLRQFDER